MDLLPNTLMLPGKIPGQEALVLEKDDVRDAEGKALGLQDKRNEQGELTAWILRIKPGSKECV